MPSHLKPLDLQPADRPEVFGIGGQHTQIMFKRGGGDEGVEKRAKKGDGGNKK